MTALRKIISGYTREAGVRTLERQIAHVCRKADKILLTDSKQKSVSVTPASLSRAAWARYKYKEDTHQQAQRMRRGQRPGLDQCGRRDLGSGSQRAWKAAASWS